MANMQILLNHVVPGDLTAAAIVEELGSAGGSIVIQTLLDQDVYVTTSESGLSIQSRGLKAPGALVLTPDVTTCVGPVHVIDAVLLPALPDGTFTDFGAEDVPQGTAQVTGEPEIAGDPGSGAAAGTEDPPGADGISSSSERAGQVQLEDASEAAPVSSCVALLGAACVAALAVMA